MAPHQLRAHQILRLRKPGAMSRASYSSTLSQHLDSLLTLFTLAFFEEAPEQAFSIVDCDRFEPRLRAHLNGAKTDDKAWYALRNIVLACGCRIALSKTASFSEASRSSWLYFENALSVYTDLVFLRGSFMIVQALILMVRH